jgi:hypothetical protein
MIPNLAALLIASHLVAAKANEIPQFSIETSCRSAEVVGLSRGRTKEACMRTEQDALDQLNRQWVQFPNDDRERCVRLATLGGFPSYVELITCLELAREVRNFRNQDPAGSQSR